MYLYLCFRFIIYMRVTILLVSNSSIPDVMRLSGFDVKHSFTASANILWCFVNIAIQTHSIREDKAYVKNALCSLSYICDGKFWTAVCSVIKHQVIAIKENHVYWLTFSEHSFGNAASLLHVWCPYLKYRINIVVVFNKPMKCAESMQQIYD